MPHADAHTYDPVIEPLPRQLRSLRSPPGFAILCDGLIQDRRVARQVMDLLSPQGYVLLRLDEMNALASQLRQPYDLGAK